MWPSEGSRDYLGLHPENSQANLFMAQVCLARDDQKPTLALRHLLKVRNVDIPGEGDCPAQRGQGLLGARAE